MSPSGPPRANKARDYLPALLVLVFSLVAVGWLEYRPVEDAAPMLAVFSPFATQATVVARAADAGGRLVAVSPLPFAVVVQSDAPGFAARLKQAGAWVLLDSSGRGVCGFLFKRSGE